MINLLKKLASLGGSTPAIPVQPVINLAAFGKHPGWDDHIPGIGLETELLAHLKQSFYVTGIGGQIDSGAWEKLEPGKRLEGYDHAFLWLREGHTLLGRLWSSSDRKGRAKYPMVLCAESRGAAASFLLGNIWQELEELKSRCRSLTTSAEVVAACQDSQARLRARLDSFQEAGGTSLISPETRRHFLENVQFGDRSVGFLRILHELEDLQGHPVNARGTSGGASRQGRSRHLRVPAIGRRHDEIFPLWTDFFRCAMPGQIPLLLIWRAGGDWLDVIVGEPSGDEFFCLQAAPLALPLSTQIPYELKPELAVRLQNLTATFLGTSPATSSPAITETPPAPKPPAATPPEVKPPVTKLPDTKPPVAEPMVAKPPPSPESSAPAPAKLPGKLLLILSLCLLVFVLGGVWLFIPSHGPGPSASVVPPTVSAPSVPVAAAASPQKPEPTTQPDDANALASKKIAQEKLDEQARRQQQENDYQAAMQLARKAMEGRDYSNALAQAGVALSKKPQDAGAMGLQQQAQGKLDELAVWQRQERKYQTALRQAQAALQGKDYATAIAQARAALAFRPNDIAAQDLLNQAQRLQTVEETARQQQEQFEVLLMAGQTAFDHKDYETAAAKAGAALELQPENQDARKLKESAGVAGSYQQALAAGQAALQQKNTGEALRQAAAALAVNPTGTEALKLQADAANAEDVQRVQTYLSKNDFASAVTLCNQHSNEPVFAGWLNQIVQSHLQAIDDQLEIYEVWFGMLGPDNAKSAAARSAGTRKTAQDFADSYFSDQLRITYTDLVGRQESQLKALRQLDVRRADVIAKLKKTISEHP